MEIRHLFLVAMIVTMMIFSSVGVQSQGNDAPIQNIDDELPLVKFRDISNQSGLGVNIENWEQDKTDVESFTPGVSWGDYDNDGWIDIFITANYDPSDLNSTAKPHLMHNNGDGTFTDVTLEAGITIEGFGLGLLIADLNNDGWPDIHVSNDYVTNDILYINNQDGTFSNQSSQKLKHQSQFSMGSDIADFNNDLKPDLITLDMLGEDNYRKKTTIGKNSYQVYISNEQWGYEYQHVRNMLHLNNGEKAPFSEIGMYAGIYQTDWSWSPLFGDVDNDGQRDLLVTNGFPRDITDKDFANYRADVGSIATVRQLLDSIPIVKIPNYAFKNQSNFWVSILILF